MNYVISEGELTKLLIAAGEQGAARVIQRLQPADDAISQAEAWRCYGRQAVTRWRKQGRLKPVRRGEGANGKITFSRAQLDALAHGLALSPYIERLTLRTT